MDILAVFFSTTIKLFALMTPPAVLSAFLSATRSYDAERKKRTARRTGLAVFVIGATLHFLGEPLFALFGITLDAFRIGAGALLFLSAVSLMNESASHPSFSPDDDDISVVPLAIPLCMGPATIGTIMVWGASDSSSGHMIMGVVALAASSACIYATLRCSDRIERVLRRTGMAVLSKLTGLLLAAIAAQVVFTGIRSFLK